MDTLLLFFVVDCQTHADAFLCLHRETSVMSQPAPPIVSVSPSRALVDEKFSVVVENLPPGCPVTIHSLHQSEIKDYWEAYGHYISDHSGTVSGGLCSPGKVAFMHETDR